MTDELPEGWAGARIADVFGVNPRKPAADHVRADTPVSFVPMGAVDADRGAITAPEERSFGAVRKGYTAFADGDVLLAKITPCFENGKAAVASSLRNGLGFGSSEFHVFRPHGAVLAPYLFHYLRQPQLRTDAAEFMTGTAGQARVPSDHLGELELPIAPLAEQHRITAKVEALLEQVRRAKDRLDRVPLILKRFRQAVLAAACAGRLTEDWRGRSESGSAELLLMEVAALRAKSQRGQPAGPSAEFDIDVPETWCLASMDQLSARITSGSRDWKKHYVDDGPGTFVMAQNVRPMLFDRSRRQAVNPPTHDRDRERSAVARGDLLVTIVGANTGDACRVREPVDQHYVCQSVALIRPVLTEFAPFLELWLNSANHGQGQFKRWIYGEGRPHLSFDQLKATAVAVPPLSEQGEIVRRVDGLFALATVIEQRVERAAARAACLPQAILSQAFVGALVPTEAELARAQSRDYETAQVLLRRTTSATQGDSKRQRKQQAKTAQAHSTNAKNARVGNGQHLILPPMPALAPTLGEDEEVAMSALALLHAADGRMARADLARAFVLRSNPDLLRELAPPSLAQATEWAARVNSRTVPPGKLAAVLRLLEERGALAFSVNAASQSVVVDGPATPQRGEIHPWFIYEATLALLVLRSLSSQRLKSIQKRLVGEDRNLLKRAS
jgi:type I restriction enzyme S subunit